MRSHEVEHENNLWNLGTGVYLAATGLTTYSFLMALNIVFDFHPVANSAGTVLIALCIGFAMAARTSMVDLWRTMENNTRLAIVVLLCAFFSLASYAPGHWNALAGLAALHIPTALTLVSERGFARLYLLCGFTCAFSLLAASFWVAVVMVAVAGLLLFLVLSYETFYFRVVAQPVSTRISGWVPAWLAVKRFVVFGSIALASWYYLPRPRPFLLQPGASAPVEPQQRPQVDPEAFNMNLLKAFLYTMVLVLFLVGLIAFLRYLHSKFKRNRSELLAESIGVPVGSPQRLARSERSRRREKADDPLAQMVREYERFSTTLRSERAQRNPSDTPNEYAVKLRNLAALPASLLSQITASFSQARYTEALPSWDDANQFTSLIDQALRVEQEEKDQD